VTTVGCPPAPVEPHDRPPVGPPVGRRRPTRALLGAGLAGAVAVLALTAPETATSPRGPAPVEQGPAADAPEEETTDSTPPPVEPDPSAMPVGDLPGWEQVFTDDFSTPVALGSWSGSTYRTRWLGYDGFEDTSGAGRYDPDRVISVHDGTLDWYVHTADGAHRVAAMVPVNPETGWGQLYGRYSFRFRADPLPGYKLVGILWPDSDNWGEGEINFPEVGQLTPDEPIYANLFRIGDVPTGRPGEATRFTTATPASGPDWHIATIEWTPGAVTTWLDGVALGTFTQGVPDTSFHPVFQVETNLHGYPIDDAVAGHVQLDWVTMYRWSP